MKKLFASAISLFLFSSVALATPQQEQTGLDLEAAALISINQAPAVHDRSLISDLTNPLAFIQKLKDQIEAAKATLLASFDANGNGRIDPGPETKALIEGLKAIALTVGDTNQNGKIDAEDILALTKQALTKVQLDALEALCPTIKEQANEAGFTLNFRPFLKRLNEICLAQDSLNAAQ